MSELTVQTTEQRAQLSQKDDRNSVLKFGVASTSSIFADNGAEIKSNAYNSLLDMYVASEDHNSYKGANGTYNPDFPDPIQLGHHETPTVTSIRNNLNASNLADQPSYFGPNIASHSIDQEGNPVFSTGLAMDQENTAYTNDTTGTINRERGFGTSTGQEATVGSYLSRRWSSTEPTTPAPKLGEYRDHADLEYSNAPVRIENSQ